MRRCIGLCLLALGCGANPPPAPVPSSPQIGALTTLVPDAATLVAVVRPARLLAAAPTARIVRAVFPDAQLDRFQARTGVDPRSLLELVIAVHPDGRVVIARGPIDAPFAVREAGARMAPVESSVDEPLVRRAGFLGASRADVVALSVDTILYVEGTPQLAATVLAAARGHESERRSALRGLSFEAHAEAPLVIYGPEPLGVPIDTGIGMLLAGERSMAVSLRAEEGALRVMAEFRGTFPPDAHDNFRAFAESIAASDLGSALGARDALPSLRIQANEDLVALSATVDPAALADGLRALFVAEIEELIDGLAPSDAP